MAGNGPSWSQSPSPAQSDTALARAEGQQEQRPSGASGEWRLTAAQRASVATRGFCVVEGCVPVEEVAPRYFFLLYSRYRS